MALFEFSIEYLMIAIFLSILNYYITQMKHVFWKETLNNKTWIHVHVYTIYYKKKH